MARVLLPCAGFVLLLLAGCDRQNIPVDPGLVPLGEEALVQDTTRAAFERYRARWRAQRIATYTFTFERLCFCLPDYRGPFVVTVREGQIVEATREGAAVPVGDDRLVTVDRLYEILEDGVERADSYQAAYEPTLGLPASFYLDYEAQAADEEIGYRIVRFERNR